LNSQSSLVTTLRSEPANPLRWEYSGSPERITRETLRANLLRVDKPFSCYEITVTTIVPMKEPFRYNQQVLTK